MTGGRCRRSRSLLSAGLSLTPVLRGPRPHAGRARPRLRHPPRHLGRPLDRRPGLPGHGPPRGPAGPLAAGDPGRAPVLEHGGRLGRRPAGGRDHLRLPPATYVERALGQPVRPARAGEDPARRPAPGARRLQQPLRGAAPQGGHGLGARAAPLPAGRRGRARDHGRHRRCHRRARELRAVAHDGDGDGAPTSTRPCTERTTPAEPSPSRARALGDIEAMVTVDPAMAGPNTITIMFMDAGGG